MYNLKFSVTISEFFHYLLIWFLQYLTYFSLNFLVNIQFLIGLIKKFIFLHSVKFEFPSLIILHYQFVLYSPKRQLLLLDL